MKSCNETFSRCDLDEVDQASVKFGQSLEPFQWKSAASTFPDGFVPGSAHLAFGDVSATLFIALLRSRLRCREAGTLDTGM